MIFRQTAAILFLCVAGAASPAFSQDIRLTGTVRDGSASPLSGVSVKLAGLGLAAFTDATGAYAITKDLAALPPGARDAAICIPACVNGILYFGVSARSGQVRIELFTLLGRHVSTVVDAPLAPGNYAAPLYATNMSAQPYCVRVTIGTSRFLLKTASTGGAGAGKGGLRRLGDGEHTPALAKQAFTVDTILVSASGFARERKPVSSYVGSYDFVLEKTIFGLTSPADSAVITGTRKPLLSWSPDVNAVSCDVYLNISRTDYDWTAGGAPLLDNYTKIGDGIPDDSMAAPTLDDRWNYKWYVVSVDAAGNRKNSAVRTFSVYNPTVDTTVADSVPVIGGCRDLDKNGTIEPYENWRLPIGVRVNDLMSRMSKTDKAMQLFFAADRYPGAGWTTYLSPWDLRPAQISAAKAKWGIPIIPTSDFVSGFYTTFPSQGALCATRDLGIIYKCATMQRDEQLIEAFRATLSPTPETGTKVLYSRIGDGCGENADFGAAMMRAMLCAYQNGPELNPKSILAIPGHWPAGQEDMPFDAVTLQYHLKPWRAAIEAGAAAIMTGLGTNTAYFTNPNGASDNKQMIDFLRDSLHFDGVVCTEFLGSALWADCLNAGADILGNASPGVVNMASFVNQIPDARINQACARVLRVKFSLGLFENPYGNADWASAVLGGTNHLQVARTAARESMTLLKNNGALPLTLSAGDTLVVAGARANDGSSYAGWGSSFHDTTIWLTIQKQAAAKGIVAVYDSALAVHLSAHAAVCILGEGSYTNIPQWGANTVEMPQDQLALLQSYKHAGIPVIAVVIMPRPYALAWAADSADALVAAYRPGDGAGDAVAGLIFGSYAPHGRLPWQLPRSGDQIGTNTETNMLEQWDLPYDIGASDSERQRIRSLIAAHMPLNIATGDSLYGAPLYPYGFGIQGWGK